MRRNAIAMAGTLALLGLAACSGAQHSALRSAAGEPEFTLRVLPQTYQADTRASFDYDVRREGAQVVVELRVADAAQLRMAHFELDYDPAELNPIAAGASGALAAAPDDELLELSVLHVPGTAAHSQALVRYAERDGFSGDAVLAELRFEQRAFEARQAPARGTTLVSDFSEISHISNRIDPIWDQQTGELSIPHRLAGDYDQNGETNAADLAPVAANFGAKRVQGQGWFPAVLRIIDGDSNGQINAADLTVIAAKFGSRMGRYDIIRKPEFGPPYPLELLGRSGLAPWRTVTFDGSMLQGNPAEEIRRVALLSESELLGQVVWIEPVLADGSPQEPSFLHVCGGPGRLYQPWYLLSYAPETSTLSWHPTFYGDYNGDGEVNASDIGRVAGWFSTEPHPSHRAWEVDGFRDGVIDALDNFLIRAYFLSHFEIGDAIFGSLDVNDVPANPYAAELLEPLSAESREYTDFNSWEPERDLVEAQIDLPSGMYVWVRPYLDGGEYGTRSEVIQIP